MTDSKPKKEDAYRETVFLPATEFPMRGNLPQKEPEILKSWQGMDLYRKMREDSRGRKPWVLHDGPPYANGDIHMGHAMNKILKDVVVKSFAMLGYDTPYVPGWDCHGLPIEWKIEEKYREVGKDKDAVDPIKFRDECRKFAQKWAEVQSAQFQRLGISGDWKNPYLTMTNRAEAAIVREIHKFALNGALYKGAKPVMWSVVEKTALAEAEVEYREHKSVTVWIKFPVVKANLALLKDARVVIWTTTPWTLPSNRAVAFGENIEYGIYETNGQKLAVATSLAEKVKEAAKVESWECLGTFKGADLAGTICAHPLRGQGYEFDVPMLQADFVTDEDGTGFVHIAPGHGTDDFFLGQASGLEITDNITDDGKFRAHLPLFGGLEIYTQKGEIGQGNFAVIKAMDEAGALLAKGSLRHDYPHSWRSKAPVIFRATPQWFIAMDKEFGEGKKTLRNIALGAIKETKWIPSAGENRITAMIEQRPDWCISRQRAWGVPIALFMHRITGEVLRDEKVLSRIAEIFEAEGSDAWWSRHAQDFLGNAYDSEDYEQVFDIVDVWFESGSTHAFVVEDTQTWPDYKGVKQIDLYLEGSDQHRGWFQSSLLESCGTRGKAPYKAVLTHGFVLDEKGYKMSKSLGNVVDPLKMLDSYGADIMRLWVMTADYAEDIRIGQDMLKTTGDLYRRIRNTLRFLLGALDGFSEEEHIACHPGVGRDLPGKDPSFRWDDKVMAKMPELERLMLHHLYLKDKMVRENIENYEFGALANALHLFCNNELSAFYFDIRKDRLYCDRPDMFERRACRTVLYHIFDCLVTWLAPILCFTAEEAWSHRPKAVFGSEESVHLRVFPDVPESWRNDALEARWDFVKAIRMEVFAAIEPHRAAKEIGSSLEAAPVILYNEDFAKEIGNIDLAEICITSGYSTKIIKMDEKGSVEFKKASGHKCDRCWKVLQEVDEKTRLCNRCADAVKEFRKAAA